MPHGLILYLVLVAIGTALAVGYWQYRRLRRQRLRAIRNFPYEWDQILQRNLTLYRYLPANLKRELQGNVRVFLDEKNFEGCGGLTLTDEIRVTIAAEACLLLLNRPAELYPALTTVLVYPHVYSAPVREQNGAVVTEGDQLRLGESWRLGVVVLAWDAVQRGGVDAADGRNVALHEFAHQLDGEDGRVDGAPAVGSAERYRAWVHVFGEAFAQLQEQVAALRDTVLDAYGATSPAEFFAVATETFFERPHDLKAQSPDLYRVLAEFFRLDPAAWLPAPA
jgi:Mlc titration factor MtfA (ptsG expression regulator)